MKAIGFARAGIVAAALALAAAARGADGPATAAAAGSHRHNLLGEGIAVSGYDPVSYFPEGGGKPRKGLIGISLTRDGATYRFATKENLALFEKEPARYLPAYGGWCAWAAGELAKRVDVDPESFEVRDGRLFLFYRDPGLDTRALWLRKPAELVSRADANWPALSR
ncbi:MAG: YHS domain-containing (seleno)protein [Acidobacteriota bacterium]